MNVSRETFHRRLEKVAGVSVSLSVLEKFEIYIQQIKKWQAHINLISSNDLQNIEERHVIDSAQLFFWAKGSKVWADIGAGCGFPSLVLAILDSDFPSKEFRLIEKNHKKTTFLSHVGRLLNLQIKVVQQDVRELNWKDCDVITARGFSSLANLFEAAEPLRADQTRMIFLKGKKVQEEIDEALKLWEISYKLYQSHTDPSGHIVDITHVKRRKT